MFNNIPRSILNQMERLEEISARDRHNGTPQREILRSIPPETGRFIALLAASSPPGQWIEIGTSAGYSALWLSLACRLVGQKITTFEILDYKAKLARQTFQLAEVNDCVDFVHADALKKIGKYDQISFCFLDSKNEIYAECYEAIIPNMVSGGLLIADNAISHQTLLKPMLEHVLNDKRVDALVVPIGKGELVCRKV